MTEGMRPLGVCTGTSTHLNGELHVVAQLLCTWCTEVLGHIACTHCKAFCYRICNKRPRLCSACRQCGLKLLYIVRSAVCVLVNKVLQSASVTVLGCKVFCVNINVLYIHTYKQVLQEWLNQLRNHLGG